MAGSACETFPSSSDGTYDVGNVKVEDIYIKQEEEEEDVKQEDVGNKQEEWIDIKCEGDIYSEEEEEEDIHRQEQEDLNIKEEVSLGDTVYCMN
jgi:hypothetical protein